MANATDKVVKKPRFTLYKKVNTKVEYVLKIFAYIATGLLMLMMFITVVHVAGRYFFHVPVRGLTEISGFIMTISIFFLIAYVMVKDGHVAVGFLSDRLGKIPRIVMDASLFILGLAFTSIAAWATFREGLTIVANHQISPLLHVPLSIFTFLVAIGWGLLSFAIIFFVINMILKVVENE
jgi:TRAP-type transport system small permease protein